MAYRIEIALSEQNNFLNAMGVYNAIIRLLSKFGLGNITEVILRDENSFTALASFITTTKVQEKLTEEIQEQVREARNQQVPNILSRIPMGEQ